MNELPIGYEHNWPFRMPQANAFRIKYKFDNIIVELFCVRVYGLYHLSYFDSKININRDDGAVII